MPPNKKNLVIKENNNFGNKNCSNRCAPYKSPSVEDETIKIEVKNFVARVNLENFWHWCLENRESPILPNRSGENCNIPRAANSFFQFKRFVARYAKERKINGHNNQTVLSKSQSVLWSMISEERKQFFKKLYDEALEFQKRNYPEYAFHPKRQRSDLKIKSMGKKSKDTVVENVCEQTFDLENRNNSQGAAHITREEASNILPETISYDNFVNVNPNSVFFENEIPNISVDYYGPVNESLFTFGDVPSPFASSPSSSLGSTPVFSSSPQMGCNSSDTSTISTPIFHSPICNYFTELTDLMDNNQENGLCLNIPEASFFPSIGRTDLIPFEQLQLQDEQLQLHNEQLQLQDEQLQLHNEQLQFQELGMNEPQLPQLHGYEFDPFSGMPYYNQNINNQNY